MLKLIKVNVLLLTFKAVGLCVRSYAGRPKIAIVTAAGE
jgi:hypothetical protein